MSLAYREITRFSARNGGLRSRGIEPPKGISKAEELRERIYKWLEKQKRAGDDREFAAVCGRMATRYLKELEEMQLGGIR